jgi:hypothetical protein
MQPPDAATPDESLVTCGGPPSTPKVGYGQPPTATRFRKGQSGNPRGRPKGSKNVKTLLQQALNEKIMVNECGRRKKISKLQAGMKQLANKIAAGDAKPTLKIIEMYYLFRDYSVV